MTFSEQLKAQVDIVEVIGQYVRLKRSGQSNSYLGLCPFHSEKTPSFRVNGAHQFYKCFGCDAAGDVYKFVMEREGLTFPEALALLAERYNIPMPRRQRSDDPETQHRAALLEMHDIAADIFHRNLLSAAGAAARSYLESRGVSRDAIEEFRLGLSDASGNQVLQRFERFERRLFEESGLLFKRDDGTYYARFRNRLMFPIQSESGKIIAFGGRALQPGDEPKYLNSPETKIYKKSAVLYNLHRAKIEARKRDRMILVEGYMDVIGIYSAGVHEVVATCGTSLGSDQVRAVRRHVSQQGTAGEVILNFDSDAAGARSTEKYITTLLSEGLRARILEIPSGLDPDEFIQQQGAEAYKQQLDAATPYFPWLAARAREKFDMTTATGRVDAFKSLVPAIQVVNDPLERAAIAAEIAESLHVDRDFVRAAFRHTSAAQPKRADTPERAIPPSERLLIQCCLASSEARALAKSLLSRADMKRVLECRTIFEALANNDANVPFSLEAALNRLNPREQQIVTEISFSDLTIREEQAGIQALDCARALAAKAEAAERGRLREQIRTLEREGNIAEAMRLTGTLNQMRPTSSEA